MCPVDCEDAVEPAGVNVSVYWDKTSNINGISTLHLDKNIKHLTDCYGRVKERFFASLVLDIDVNDSKANFFLNSVGQPFSEIKMDHVSAAMGISVTAYSFRNINSTWGTSNPNCEVRRLEAEALQHSSKVAHECYKQNKVSNTQLYVQSFIEDEEYFPDALKELVGNDRKTKKEVTRETEKLNKLRRYEELQKIKHNSEIFLQNSRPLGPKCRISGSLREEFRELVCSATGIDLLQHVLVTSVKDWRHWIVRLICNSGAGWLV